MLFVVVIIEVIVVIIIKVLILIVIEVLLLIEIIVVLRFIIVMHYCSSFYRQKAIVHFRCDAIKCFFPVFIRHLLTFFAPAAKVLYPN